MKKYILNDASQKEVKMGDTLSCAIKVTKNTLPKLIEKNIVKEVEEITWDSIIKSIESKPGYITGMIDSLYYVSPISLFHLMLREIAIEMDKKYVGHIKDCEEVYIFNAVHNLLLVKYTSDSNTTFESFSAFRYLEEAIKARQILMPLIEKIYGI